MGSGFIGGAKDANNSHFEKIFNTFQKGGTINANREEPVLNFTPSNGSGTVSGGNVNGDKIQIDDNVTVYETTRYSKDSSDKIISTKLSAASGARRLGISDKFRLDVWQNVDVDGNKDANRSGLRHLVVDKNGNELERFTLSTDVQSGRTTRTQYTPDDVPTGTVSTWYNGFENYNKTWVNPKNSNDWAKLDVQNIENHPNGMYTLTVNKTTSNGGDPIVYQILMDIEGNEIARSDVGGNYYNANGGKIG